MELEGLKESLINVSESSFATENVLIKVIFKF